jgi:spore germination protein KC
MIPLLFVIVSVTTGCWDRKEILDLAIVMITALDEGKKPGTYRVHMHVVDPKRLVGSGQAAQGKERPIEIFTVEGRNLDETRFIAEQMLPRDINTTHRRVLCIGESLARRGIKEVLDQISRNPQNRLNTMLIVAENTKAARLIDLPFTMETFGSEIFREIVNRKLHAPTTLRDFFIASTTPGQQPIAVSFTSTKQNKITASGIAIFKDNKLSGFVKGTEATLLTGLLGGVAQKSIKVTLPEVKNSLSVTLNRLKVHRKVDLSKGKPKYSFEITAYGRIMDNRTDFDLSNPVTIRKLDQSFANEIERSFQSLYHHLQTDFRTDSTGLGTMVYRKNPKYWRRIEKDWQDIYPKVKIKWHIQAKITGVGTVGAPLYLPENEVKK